MNQPVLEDSQLQQARENLHKLEGQKSEIFSQYEIIKESASLETTAKLRSEFAHLNLEIKEARLLIPEPLNHPRELSMKSNVEQQASIQQQSLILAKQRKDVHEFQNTNTTHSSQTAAKRKPPPPPEVHSQKCWSIPFPRCGSKYGP